MAKPIYVLGTGLSHDGSACLLKDGRIVVGIEKERLTRLKHDGGNDTAAIRYCLETEGIALEDLSVIVQNANFGDFEFGNAWFGGQRVLTEDCPVPVVTISHHLAHAYSALGMCPYEECNILVVDGCGNGADECKGIDRAAGLAVGDDDTRHLYYEKDSYYTFRGGKLEVVCKDFSPWGLGSKGYPLTPNTTKHSIGGVYAAVSTYCLRDRQDLGKLMGLAPYGHPGAIRGEIFELRDDRVFVRYDWMKRFDRPARSEGQFRADFQYYADIAWWVQRELERTLVYLLECRLRVSPCEYLAYSGGVALNAVANSLLRRRLPLRDLFVVPAAGDNGIALGCAFYGWLEVLGQSRRPHDGSTCFGRTYAPLAIRGALDAAVVGAAQAAGTLEVPANLLLFLIRLVHQCFHAGRAGGWTGSLCWKAYNGAPLSTLVDGTSCHLLEGEIRNPSAVVSGPLSAMMAFFLGNLHPVRAVESGRLHCSNLDGLLTFYRAIDWEEVGTSIRQYAGILGGVAERELRVVEPRDSVKAAARLLADGKIVAWFQDGSEFGPRALGRRSLLADPGLPDVQEVINRDIKRREDFRPFAPSVLREDASNYFDCDFESPYMIMVAQVRAAWAERLRGVVHRDGSARLQTVSASWNPSYHRLLTEFRKISGISVLLNTSFNRRGMPIVETPEEALSFFRETSRLDALIMDRFLVTRA